VQALPTSRPADVTNQAGFNRFSRGVGTDAFLPGADAQRVRSTSTAFRCLATQGAPILWAMIHAWKFSGTQGTLFRLRTRLAADQHVTPDPTNTFEATCSWVRHSLRAGLAYLNVPIFNGRRRASPPTAWDRTISTSTILRAARSSTVFNYGGRVKLLWDITEGPQYPVGFSYTGSATIPGLIFENTLPSPLINGISPIPRPDPKADLSTSTTSLSASSRSASWLIRHRRWTCHGSTQGHRLLPGLVSEDVAGPVLARAPSAAQHAGKNAAVPGELQFLSNADTLFSDRADLGRRFLLQPSHRRARPVPLHPAPGAWNALPGSFAAITTRIRSSSS